ncbi:MAG TPA: hypothetical protein VKB56_09510 [Terriglobales bacterium]|nr:hypothetical protein [Terriglobales bacterium]
MTVTRPLTSKERTLAPRLVTAAVLLAFVVSMIVTAPSAARRKRVHGAL